MKKFTEFLKESCGEERLPEEIPALHLNNYVGNFLLNIKKRDGKEYEPNSLTSYHRGIAR